MSLAVLNVAYPFAPVAPGTAGGAEQVVRMLDGALHRAGHRSLVVACDGSSVQGELIEVPRPTGELDPVAVSQGQGRHARAVEAVLAREKIDLVHMHGIDFHAYLPPPGVPVLVTLHLPLSWYPDQALRPARPQTWFNCVSAAQNATAARMPCRVDPIENGVELSAFATRHARRRFALTLARICPEKGIHLAVEAAKLADVPLLIAGEVFPYDAHRRYFEREVRPRLDRFRRWIGPVGPARKRRLLSAARCVLIPSLVEETSSLVAREAAAAGTPVIAFAHGALRQTVEEGRTGYLVDDMAGMARAIGRSGEIDSDTCRTVARRRFAAETMLTRYFDLYARLAGKESGQVHRLESH